jgi:hypothetical protein
MQLVTDASQSDLEEAKMLPITNIRGFFDVVDMSAVADH